MTLVFASNNKHKLDEVRAIMPEGIRVLSLRDIGFEQEIDENGTTLEQNSRIKAQAVVEFISGQHSAVSSQIDGVFADDTGLEIDALGGRPGVYTARWYLEDIGNCKSESEIFAANRAKALRELDGQTNRNAQFRTVITLMVPTPNPSLKGREQGAKSGGGLEDKANKLSSLPFMGEGLCPTKRPVDGCRTLSGLGFQVSGVVRGRIATEEYGEGGFGYDPIFIPDGYDRTFGELPAEIKNGISHRARALEALVARLNEWNR